LVAKLEERDAAHVAGLLIERREFVGCLSDAQWTGSNARCGAALEFIGGACAPLGLVEIDPGMILAEVEFTDRTCFQFRDMEHRLLFALLTLHGRSVLPGTCLDVMTLLPAAIASLESAHES
jgi:hypothetical protein